MEISLAKNCHWHWQPFESISCWVEKRLLWTLNIAESRVSTLKTHWIFLLVAKVNVGRGRYFLRMSCSAVCRPGCGSSHHPVSLCQCPVRTEAGACVMSQELLIFFHHQNLFESAFSSESTDVSQLIRNVSETGTAQVIYDELLG